MENISKRKQQKFIKAAILTVGIIVVIVALLFIFRHKLVDLFFTPDSPNNGGLTVVNPDDGNNIDLSDTKSDKVWNFFIVGHDRAANLADVSMLVSFNTYECTASIMQLPVTHMLTTTDTGTIR